MALNVIQRSDRSQDLSDIGAEEWAIRRDLAAVHQLVELYGMSDMASTHISARVPGPDDHFLLNPYGMFFEEITASCLLKLDVKGNVIVGDPSVVNGAGFVIHSAIHMARPELACVLHTHTVANNAVAMQEEGLLPLSQRACMLLDFVRYHDYEGVADNLDERERIVRDLGDDGRIIVLRNHGALTVGRTVAEAFVWMYRYEMACQYQVAGLSGARPLHTLSGDGIAHVRAQGKRLLSAGGPAECGRIEWPALMRKLERERGSSYRS